MGRLIRKKTSRTILLENVVLIISLFHDHKYYFLSDRISNSFSFELFSRPIGHLAASWLFNVSLWVWQMVRQGIDWNLLSTKVSKSWLLSHGHGSHEVICAIPIFLTKNAFDGTLWPYDSSLTDSLLHYEYDKWWVMRRGLNWNSLSRKVSMIWLLH